MPGWNLSHTRSSSTVSQRPNQNWIQSTLVQPSGTSTNVPEWCSQHSRTGGGHSHFGRYPYASMLQARYQMNGDPRQDLCLPLPVGGSHMCRFFHYTVSHTATKMPRNTWTICFKWLCSKPWQFHSPLLFAEISIWNDLPVWEVLKQKGCADLIELHQQKYGYEMEPTCQGVTRPDNAIISRHLIPYIGHIRVLAPEWFATHCPVFFNLQMPHERLHKMTLKMPTQLGHIGDWSSRPASSMMPARTPPLPLHLKNGERNWNTLLTWAFAAAKMNRGTELHISEKPLGGDASHVTQ